MDCLFVHAGDGTFLLPVGVLALADLLAREGLRARALNLSLARLKDRGFSLQAFLRKSRPRFVAIPLHWCKQSKAALETARLVKKTLPSARTVLGGFTASCFAERIMGSSPDVDFIIRGDAEEPLLDLVRGRAHDRIPNLTWRQGKTPLAYRTSQAMLDRLRFTNLELLEDADAYLLESGNWVKDARTWTPCEAERVFHYCVGRGCLRNCSVCGGGGAAQKLLCGRRGILAKSAESVATDLARLRPYCVDRVHFAFGPEELEPYYIRLFGILRKKRSSLRATFEHWGLPGPKFLAAFSTTFAKPSAMLLSPGSGSERVRRFNSLAAYSNADLERTLEAIGKAGIQPRSYFSSGYPFEKKEDLRRTRSLVERLSRIPGFEPVHCPLELDPCSPAALSPERFGLARRDIGQRTYF
ncbi:MAG: cobalamin-dependent protein [Elusimicrobiota bacterium]